MESGGGKESRGRKERLGDTPERGSPFVRFAPALLAIAGVTASFLLAWSLWRSERAGADLRLGREAAHRTGEVRRSLEATLDQLRSAVALFASSDRVEARELETFTRTSFLRHPALRSILWVEARGGDAPFVVALSAGPEARFALGVDLASTEVAPALLASRQRGDLALSAPLASGEPSGSVRVFGAIPFLPVDGRAQGFVCALVDPGPLLLAEDPAEEGHFALQLLDTSAADGALLAGTVGAGRTRDEKELPLGGRRWLLSCRDAAVSAAGRRWLPWLALGFGLAGTALLVATVQVATGRARIQRLVRERTREVRQSYDTLALEAKDRLAAMAIARRAERRLRAIIDLLPELIVVRDEIGRILVANRTAAEALGTTPEELLLSRRRWKTDAPESVTQQEERALIAAKRPLVVPELSVTDAHGRRRILRQTLIPCEAFGDDTRALLTVASDVSEQKRTTDLLRVQNRILRALARGTNPEQVLADTVLGAEELVPGLRASVLLLAPDGKRLVHGYAPHLPEAYNQAVSGLAIGPTAGSCGAAAFRNERVVVEDVNQHPNWAPYRELAARAGFRACWSQPIRSADDQVLGTFALYYVDPRKPEPFEEALIESLAHLAGLAIERARLGAGA